MIPQPALDISIVIPVHNEAESLSPLHAELDAALKTLANRMRSSPSTTAAAMSA